MRRILIIFITLLALENQALAKEILLKEEVEVKGENIFLSDLVSFPFNLSDISLGVSPIPGRERSLSKSYIQARVRALDDSLVLVGPERIRIRRESQLLDVEKVAGIAKEAIFKALAKNENVKIELVKVTCDNIYLPKGKVSYKVNRIREKGKQVLCYVEVEVDGKRIRDIEVIFEVKKFGQVVVARHKLNRNQLLGPENLKIELREITNLKSPFTTIEDLKGLRASTFIEEGTIVTSKMVEVPPLIKRGQIISILVKEGSISVTTLGKSLSDGMRGEVLRVRNLDSRKEIVARVLDSQTVIVE